MVMLARTAQLDVDEERAEVRCADFFDWLGRAEARSFDVVVGNPPFLGGKRLRSLHRRHARRGDAHHAHVRPRVLGVDRVAGELPGQARAREAGADQRLDRVEPLLERRVR